MIIPLILTLLTADFPICTEPNFTGYPAICYANDQYYTVWIDYRYYPLRSTFGARIAKDGTILDPGGNLFFSDSSGYSVDIAYDGTNFLVVTRNYC